MPPIQILPDRVANQIAAGEVIERPVAVIKELVENSLDAGATRIEIEFRTGGKSYMRVEDNGRGMTPDEALLCLERHATSKLRNADDLNDVRSFGFRGEALPSIASVSRFCLRTRHKDEAHGTEVRLNGGKLIEKKACGMPVGTRVEVAQLFNSVPARRKFLKTDATESAHITYSCRLFAIANPAVHFRVLEDNRQVFQSPAGLELDDRIREIWGRRLAGDLVPVDVTDAERGLRLSGLTAKPGVGRSTRRELITLVNRRPIDNRTLGFAVLDAYHGQLPKGRYPPAFLFLEINPQEMDVNVHPAKREVRFRNEGEIRRFVLAAISETLEKLRREEIPETLIEEPAAGETNDGPLPRPPSPQLRPAPPRQPTSSAAEAGAPPDSKPSVTLTPHRTSATSGPESPPATAATSNQQNRWRLLARLKERYALMETPRGLVILHLRQADQRIRFEQILRAYDQREEASQGLLIAEPIEFEPLAAATLATHLELLNERGFAIEPFGRNFYRIEAVPDWLPPDRAERFLHDLVDELRQRGSMRRDDRIIWEQIASLAAQSSYQRSDRIPDEAVERLAEKLLRCEQPHSSPFGKPTYQEISWNELERKFGGT